MKVTHHEIDFRVSKKIFFLTLALTGAALTLVALYSLHGERSRDDAQKSLAVSHEALVLRYENEMNSLFKTYLFEPSPGIKNTLQALREKTLQTRVPKEFQNFHLRLVTALDAALIEAVGTAEVHAAPPELLTILQGESWVKTN